MRKSFLTLMLAIVSSVWMLSGATCLTQAPDELYWNFITVSGTIQWLDSPCEEGEECPPCVTPAIVTSDKTYYLSSSNQEVRDFLDRIELAPIPAIYLLPLQARASGTPYTQGSFDFLVVNNIDDLYVQYFSDQLTRIPSLCDEWNVWHESFESFGPISFDKVVKYLLTTDTIIADSNYYTLQRYKRLEQDGQYMGAMREGNNRDIYYVPAGSTNEFLLYAFNAQVGEVLNNLYLGGFEENGYSGRVEAISDGSPRLFTIRVLYPTGMGVEPGESFSVTWIEGVGSPETPYGLAVVPTVPADVGIYTLLCAYKNGEQIYTSRMGEQYGCEHDQHLLCDEWNVLSHSMPLGPEYESFKTLHFHLTSDTIINETRYVKLEQDGQYKGAIREGENGKIYFIPAGSTHEYLLYDFNAQAGDRLTNLWYGGDPEWCPNGYNATVLSISDETPRVFTIEVEYIISDSDGDHIIPWLIYWTEGVGLSDGPAGQFCPGPDCACSCGQVLLCAYKNGEQVYVSEMGEQYGCVYNYDPYAAPTDTIPLFSYTGDDPGSSTVDPVDPNQVVATLNGGELTIREFSNVDVTYTLRHNEPAKMPAQMQTSASDTFRDEVTIQITQSGEYLLQLTNPSWNYIIYGQFYYAPQDIDHITNEPSPITTKVIKNGQIYILRGDKVYTIDGREVK